MEMLIMRKITLLFFWCDKNSQIFWFGDLNYRLCLEDNSARQLIKKQDWSALQEFDQLKRELEDGGVFQGWKEGDIEFAPTYKYSSSNCNRYSGGFPRKSGEKKRTPAWYVKFGLQVVVLDSNSTFLNHERSFLNFVMCRCDRILWDGKGVKQLSYFRSESKFSDHRPVSALFSSRIEVRPATSIAAKVVPLPAGPVI